MIRGVAALIALLLPLTLLAQESAPGAEPAEAEPQQAAAEDIERVIRTLEDPEARAELIRELRVLLEVGQAEPEEDADGLLTGRDMLAAIREMVSDAWEAIVSIDPEQLLISIGVTLLIIVAALVLRGLIIRLLRSLYRRLTHRGDIPADDVIEVAGHDTGEVPPDVEAAHELPRSVTRLINLIIAVLAVALIADTWGAGLGAVLESDLGSRIVEAGLAIGLIVVITMVAWHIAGLVVARVLTVAGGARNEERRKRRLDTLVPLLRSVLQGVIGVMAGLLILSELGINIGPLLAGAGILGLAIGFGAQTLVKDLLTGVTILLEDGATVGDVVQAAGHAGVVEEMRVRVMRLRDLAGAVHLIPYSEVTTIVNLTQDFSYYLLEVGVAYREDTDEVCAVLREIVDEMRQEPDRAGEILEPLEVLGVDKFADSAVIIKARIKTVPGRQWATGREFNRRMKKQFDRRDIEIPFPHATVYFGEPKTGPAPPARLAIVDGSADPEDRLAAPQRPEEGRPT